MSQQLPGVFISYRRETGATMARLLSDFLETQGFDPFLDVDGLTSGHFDKQILLEIESRPHFLLVCTRGALDRCVQDGDWVRLEVAHAISTGRNIVPVLEQGFTWPAKSSLPPEITEVCAHHAFEYSHTHWRSTRQKLLERIVGAPVAGIQLPETPVAASGFGLSSSSDFTGDYAVLANVLEELERTAGVGKEPFCWEFIELSAPFMHALGESVAFWGARLQCALEVDCPGVGAAAARRVAQLAAALPEKHPIRGMLVAADRRRWRLQPPPDRDWKAWESRPHHPASEGRDAEELFRDAVRSIKVGRNKASGKSRPLVIGTLRRLCELGFEPAMIFLSDTLLSGRFVGKDRAGAIELLRAAASDGNDFARLRLGKFLAQRGDPECLPLLEECARGGNSEASRLLATYGSEIPAMIRRSSDLVSAKAGDPEAACRLAQGVLEDAIVGKSSPEIAGLAMDYCRLAAESGFTDAQYLLFRWLSTPSTGGTPNAPEAVHWLQCAAGGGHPRAKELLEQRCASAEQRKEWGRSLDRAIDLRNLGDFRAALRLLRELASELEKVPESRPPEYWAVLYSRALTYELLKLPALAKYDLNICAPFYPLAAERLQRYI
jgi:TPR repeat protein